MMSEDDQDFCFSEENCPRLIKDALTTLFASCDCTTPDTQPTSNQPLFDIIESVVQKRNAVPTFIRNYDYFFTSIAERDDSDVELFLAEFDIEYQAMLYALLLMIGTSMAEAATTFSALSACAPKPCEHCLVRSLLLLEGDLWGHIFRGVCTQSSSSSDSEMEVV